MKFLYKSAMLLLAFALLATTGCKKSSSNNSLLVLNIYPYFGTDTLVNGKWYQTASGDSVSFSRTSFYISNLQLTTTSGTVISDSGYILVSQGNFQNIIAGAVPTGSYKSISFNIGINSGANHIDPSTYSNGYLAAQTPSMHFATDNIGYIFMAVEGLTDTAHGTTSSNRSFSYHIGTDSLLQTVNLPDHSVAPYNAVFNANGGQFMTINIIADFSQLTGNINLAANPVTNTTDVPVLADTLAAHIPGMFRYQK